MQSKINNKGALLKVRPANLADARRIWEIRNSPQARSNSMDQQKIPYERHLEWFSNTYFRGLDNICFVAENDEQEVISYCRLDGHGNDFYTISVAVDEKYQGRGIGTSLIGQAITQFDPIKILRATVKRNNPGSVQIFIKNGFQVVSANNECLYLEHLPSNKLNQIYDAVFVLGGSLVKDGDIWRTTRITDEGDNFGPTNDSLRVIAAKLLYQAGLTRFIVIHGGRGQYKNNPGFPTVASVMKAELTAAGISNNILIEEDGSGNTFQQLQKANEIAEQERYRRIGVISNCWHIRRVRAITMNAPSLANFQSDFLPAESIVWRLGDPDQVYRSNTLYVSQRFMQRLEIEDKGVDDILRGIYKYI